LINISTIVSLVSFMLIFIMFKAIFEGFDSFNKT
jgi:hypothetical protein